MHWKQARPDPVQQYYNKVDHHIRRKITPVRLDPPHAPALDTNSVARFQNHPSSRLLEWHLGIDKSL
jgi:hypothetical protein